MSHLGIWTDKVCWWLLLTGYGGAMMESYFCSSSVYIFCAFSRLFFCSSVRAASERSSVSARSLRPLKRLMLVPQPHLRLGMLELVWKGAESPHRLHLKHKVNIRRNDKPDNFYLEGQYEDD